MPSVTNQQAMVAIELSDKSLAAFNASLARYMASVKKNGSVIVRKMAGSMLTDMTLLSPVDTGRFRAGWHAGYRALGARPPAIPSASLDLDSEGNTIVKKTSRKEIAIGESQGTASVSDVGGETVVEVRNGVRYGPYLEAGLSRQAPRGIVRVTVERYRRSLDEQMRRMNVEGAT